LAGLLDDDDLVDVDFDGDLDLNVDDPLWV